MRRLIYTQYSQSQYWVDCLNNKGRHLWSMAESGLLRMRPVTAGSLLPLHLICSITGWSIVEQPVISGIYMEILLCGLHAHHCLCLYTRGKEIMPANSHSEFVNATSMALKKELGLTWVAHGVVVKTACFEDRWSLVRAPLWPPSFKEKKCFSTAHS